jgi:hypothetical protein
MERQQCLNVVRMVSFQLALNATRLVDVNDPANEPNTVPPAVFWALFTDSWSFLSITLPKISVAFLLIRIFQPQSWLKKTIMSMAVVLNVICVGGFIICFVQCNPVAGQWDPYRHPDTKCWPRDVQIDYALVGSCKSTYTPRRLHTNPSALAFSAFLDFSYAVYPGFVIWNLQMSTWKRLSTMALMGLGLG